MANNSPMELVHQIFVKLGARYVVITDTDGICMFLRCGFVLKKSDDGKYFTDQGVIDKKTWLAFLSGLEERS